MPFNQRLKIIDAINGSSIHQSLSTMSSQIAMARCQAAVMTDPSQTMDTLRSLVQTDINLKIRQVLDEYIESHFRPAARNMKINLGEENVSSRIIDEVCISVLENAKDVFSTKQEIAKKLSRVRSPGQVLKRSGSNLSSCSPVSKKSMIIKSGLGRPNTDLILVNKAGRPVRREGPKWEPERLNKDTLFILGSRANKALGFGQTRGRLYIKHPELFKYSGDQTDKEWLAKANLMSTTGGKAYLMVLGDIMELAESPEYSSHPKQQPGELVGFTVPDWMIDKMKTYIDNAKTDPMTSDEELLRVAEEYAAQMDEDIRMKKAGSVKRDSDNDLSGLDSLLPDTGPGNKNVAQFLNDMKHEDTVDDDLQNLDPAFLQGMNLHNLVREFELETSGMGSEQGILALADEMLHVCDD